jgi:hypothetical protein
MRNGRTVVTSLAIAALLLGAVAVARGRPGPNAYGPPEVAGGGRGFAAAEARLGSLPALLTRLPIGTTVDVGLWAADPAEGGEAISTLSMTVGEDSEAAFAQALAGAAEDASFVVYDIGEVRHTIVLDGVGEGVAGFGWRNAPQGPALALGLGLHGLGEGDTLTVEVYGEDPADGGAPIESVVFAYGVDSLAGFQAEVHAALAQGAYAVVTTSPRTVTLDLSEAPVRFGGPLARGRMHAGGGPMEPLGGALRGMPGPRHGPPDLGDADATAPGRQQHVPPGRGARR